MDKRSAHSLRPIQIGQTFNLKNEGGKIETYTRLPDAVKPLWPFEPFVIRAHGSAYVDEMTFEQGQKWFGARGLVAIASAEKE